MKRLLIIAAALAVALSATAQVFNTSGGTLPKPHIGQPQYSTDKPMNSNSLLRKGNAGKGEGLPSGPVELAQGWYLGLQAYGEFRPEDYSGDFEPFESDVYGLEFGYMRPFLTAPKGYAHLYLGGGVDLGYTERTGKVFGDIGPFIGAKAGHPWFNVDLRFQAQLMYCTYEYEAYEYGYGYEYDYGWHEDMDTFFGVRFCLGAGVWVKHVNLRLKYYIGSAHGYGLQLGYAF